MVKTDSGINFKKTLSLENVLFYIFIFFCFFPYLNIFRIPTDAQPNALIIAILIFILGANKYKYPAGVLYLSFFMILSYVTVSILFVVLDFDFFRSLIGYFSFFFISIISYICFKHGYVLKWKWFKLFVFLNILVSFLQKVLGFNFIEFLFYRVSTTESRGVTGLAPEPTFNATIAIFCVSLYFLNYYDKKRNYILVLIFLWIILLAQSSTIVLMAAPVFLLYLAFKHFGKVFFPLLLSSVLLFGLIKDKIETNDSSRLVTVLKVIFSQPNALLILDPSVNERISHIVVPIYVSFKDYLQPHGVSMDNLNQNMLNIRKTTNFFYFYKSGVMDIRIMSGWSMMFYEVGFFAFMLFFYMLYLVFYKLDNYGVEFLGGLLFLVIVFSAITVNTAIVPFIFGNIVYNSSKIRVKLRGQVS